MVTPSNTASLSAVRFAAKVPARPGRANVPQPGRKPLAMRKYQIASLMSDGSVRHSDQIGPAMPIFESAFSAFAHGTLITTKDGPVAVEDLVPGMKIQTTDQGLQQLLWVGSMTLVPRTEDLTGAPACRLTRIMSGTYGAGRPQADLMAGPGARVLRRASGQMAPSGTGQVFVPARKLVDGENVVEITPPRPVTVYHLCLRRHAIITAAGMDVESFHPGPGFERNIGPKMLILFLSFFPHIRQPRDFGPLAHPRLPLDEWDLATAVA